MCDSPTEGMGHFATKVKQFFCPEKDAQADKVSLFFKEKLNATSNTSLGQSPLGFSDGEECTENSAEYLCQLQVLECKLTEQQELVEEHENKIRILEDIIQRQLLVIKEKDKDETTEKKEESKALQRESSVQSLSSTDSRGVFDFFEDMVGSVENVFSDKSVRHLAKQVKAHEKELQQQRETTARLQQTLEEQLANLKQVDQIVDQTERFSAIEEHMNKQSSELNKCMKQLDDQNTKITSTVKRQDGRLDDAWSAIWINIVTVILAVFFSQISSLWP